MKRAIVVLALAARRIVVRPRESVLDARVASWVILVSVVARIVSLPRAQRLVAVPVPGAAVRGDVGTAAARLAQAIDRVLGVNLFVFRRSCWKRAMVLQRFLALNGIASRITFGVRKAHDGTVVGHAWLERDGRPFLEADTAPADYVVTFRLPLDSATS